MAVKRTIIEDVPSDDEPTVVRKTKTIVDPGIHTPVVDAKEEVVDSSDSSTVKQTKVVREPLVQTEHPQEVYETKKAIFRSWQVIWYILAVIEVILAFRMTFKAIGADPTSGFVALIYALSAPLAFPFSGIIRSSFSTDSNSDIEWSTIVAAVVFALIAWGLVSLIHMLRPVTPEEVDQTV
jgi:hypothetical protein